MAASGHLNPREFDTTLPTGHPLLHVTSDFRLPDIAEKGLQPSRYGESGPGLYTTPDASFADRMHRGKVTDAGRSFGHTFKLETTQPLRLLDRTKPGGEEAYSAMQRQDYHGVGKTLAAAGYQGVNYKSGSKQDHEVVIHDPKHVRIVADR